VDLADFACDFDPVVGSQTKLGSNLSVHPHTGFF
jgi:hypothetical protein